MFFNYGKWLAGGTFLLGLLLCFVRKPLHIALNARVLWIFAGLCLIIFLFSDIVNIYLTRYILYAAPFIVLGGVYTFFTIIDLIVPTFQICRSYSPCRPDGLCYLGRVHQDVPVSLWRNDLQDSSQGFAGCRCLDRTTAMEERYNINELSG